MFSKALSSKGKTLQGNNMDSFLLKLPYLSQWINDTSMYMHLLGF